MDQIVLLKITSLHARLVQPAGLKLRHKDREFATGTIAASLDETAAAPANLGLINLTSGAIRLSWAITATLPVMADALAAGQISPKESGSLRIGFDEEGQILKDGAGFDLTGTGSIAPGSYLSGLVIVMHSNFVRPLPGSSRETSMTKSISAGNSVRCALLPESFLEVKIPKSLGGGTQRVNLVGGFNLVPAMTLGGRAGAKRARR